MNDVVGILFVWNRVLVLFKESESAAQVHSLVCDDEKRRDRCLHNPSRSSNLDIAVNDGVYTMSTMF